MGVTLDNVILGANDLASGGRRASVKFALWIAACSANQGLEENGRMARVLAQYVRGGLPDRETLTAELLAVKCNLYGTMLDAIYHAEMLEQAGELRAYGVRPRTRAGWLAWRDRLHALYHDQSGAHGMAWKTISFAALILWPTACELVPVDRFVMARLGETTKTGKPKGSPQVRATYLKIEGYVRSERDALGFGLVPLGLWHWLTWEQWRQQVGASLGMGGQAQSHAALSCRAY